jgi:hypothetical protein
MDALFWRPLVGGSLSTLSFEETTKNHLSPSSRRGGGIRGAFRASRGRMVFVTLTYPHQSPDDPERCKKGHLKALRLDYCYPSPLIVSALKGGVAAE